MARKSIVALQQDPTAGQENSKGESKVLGGGCVGNNAKPQQGSGKEKFQARGYFDTIESLTSDPGV